MLFRSIGCANLINDIELVDNNKDIVQSFDNNFKNYIKERATGIRKKHIDNSSEKENLNHMKCNRLKAIPEDMFYFGGSRFDPMYISNYKHQRQDQEEDEDELWKDFGKSHFILPQVELCKRKFQSNIEKKTNFVFHVFFSFIF